MLGQTSFLDRGDEDESSASFSLGGEPSGMALQWKHHPTNVSFIQRFHCSHSVCKLTSLPLYKGPTPTSLKILLMMADQMQKEVQG